MGAGDGVRRGGGYSARTVMTLMAPDLTGCGSGAFLIYHPAPVSGGARGASLVHRGGLDRPGPSGQPDFHPHRHLRGPGGDFSGLSGRQPGNVLRVRHLSTQCLDQLPGGLCLGGSDLPGRHRDRAGVLPAAAETHPGHRHSFFPAAVSGGLGLCLLGQRLDLAGLPDCRHRPVHHLHGGGLCGDGGDGPERNGPGQAHPGRLLHHRPGHRPGPGADLRQLRLLAADFHPGHRGGPVAHAGRHPLGVSQVGRPGE